MFKRMWAALPLILVLVLPAFGQTPAKDRTSNFRVVALQAGQGPTQALAAAGCKIGWLAQVMADSNINPAQTRRLPRGKELFIEGDCAKEPPPLVAQLTSFILRTDRTLAESRGLARQIAGLRRERDTARGELAELRKGFSAAENKAKTLAAELEKTASARRSLASRSDSATRSNTGSGCCTPSTARRTAPTSARALTRSASPAAVRSTGSARRGGQHGFVRPARTTAA